VQRNSGFDQDGLLDSPGRATRPRRPASSPRSARLLSSIGTLIDASAGARQQAAIDVTLRIPLEARKLNITSRDATGNTASLGSGSVLRGREVLRRGERGEWEVEERCSRRDAHPLAPDGTFNA
jgi:hypothetical protein